MQDPFSTTAELAYKGGSSLGESILGVAGMYAQGKQKEKLLEKEAEAKQKYKDPLQTLKDSLEIEKIKKELSGEITDKETLNRATTLRKEFNADQTYKNFEVLKRSEDQMKEAYKLATSPNVSSRIGADQALAVTFQKMLDPTSVVRESEYARTPEGVAFMNKMSSFVDKFQKGGLQITDADRLALIQASNKMLKSGKRQMNSHISRYKSLAKDYQVPSRYVLGDIDTFDVGRTFMLDGQPYDIPDSDVDEFLQDNPSAQEI